MALKLIGEPFIRALFDLPTDTVDKPFNYEKAQSQLMLLLVGYLGGDDNPANNKKLAGDAMEFIQKYNLQKDGNDKYFQIGEMYYALLFPSVQDLKSTMTTTGRGGGSHFTDQFDPYTAVRGVERGDMAGIICDDCYRMYKLACPMPTSLVCRHQEFQTSQVVEESILSSFVYIEYPSAKRKNNSVSPLYL